MPHVDEGQIHAYLDRQGEFADPVRRRELGKHIADCSPCTRALKEARRLRGEAEELLRVTRIREVQAPPFAEIAARAESRGHHSTIGGSHASDDDNDVRIPTDSTRRRARAWRSLALAATIVLAVGIGWSIRPMLMEPSAPAATEFRENDAAAARASEDAPAEPAELADESLARQRRADAPAAPPAATEPAPSPPAEVAREESVRTDARAGRGADSQEIRRLASAAASLEAQRQGFADDSVGVADSIVTVGLERADSVARETADSAVIDSTLRTAERELTPARDTTAAARMVTASPEARVAPTPLSFDSDVSRLPGDWNVITREEAEAILGGPLVWVPELSIVGLGRTATANGVRMMQSAGSGALLELEIRAIVPASAGNRNATRPIRIRAMSGSTTNSSTGTATIGRYLITAKAGVPEASLRRFLEQLTYAPTANQLRNH